MKMKLFLPFVMIFLAGIMLVFSGCNKKTSENPFTQNNGEGQFGKIVTEGTTKPADSTLKGQEEQDSQSGELTYMEKNEIKNEMAPQLTLDVYKNRPEVKYGTVKHETYYSKTCKMERGFSILLPASYDGQKKFPVVYFQHGIFGDEYGTINDENNKIKEVTANMAADCHAKEMIMVFGHMYATDNPDLKPGFDAVSIKPYDNFINELVNDLMPYIESHYSVLTGRENTAVCGFSMGGRESLYIGLLRPDLFGYVGAISPAPGLVPGKDKFMVHEGSLQEDEVHFPKDMPKPYVVMICCGTKDSVVGQFPKTYHQLFQKNGIDHLWFEVMAADHDNKAIRTGLYHFIQRIFQ